MKKQVLFIIGLLTASMSFAQIPSTWNQISVPTNADLLDIHFPTNQIGYISTRDGELLKTIDYGLTWDILDFSITNPNPNANGSIYDIEFSDENHGYMLMNVNGPSFAAAYLYETTDGGITWTTIEPNGNIAALGSIYSTENNQLFLGGHGWFESSLILEYADEEWTQNVGVSTSVSPTEAVVTEMDFYNDLGLASTHGEYILRSTDGGQSWDTTNTGLGQSAVITSVLIADPLTAYAGYYYDDISYGILKSEDAGLTWFQDMSSATFFYPKWTCVENSNQSAINGKIYAGASIFENDSNAPFKGMIFESQNMFEWTYTQMEETINAIASKDVDQVVDWFGNTVLIKNTFAIGNKGLLVNNSVFPSANQETLTSQDIQLFPNPCTDYIRIQLNDVENWNVQIFDTQMKRIVPDVTMNHNNTKEINVTQISVGIYTVVLSKENESITKHFVKN